MGCFQAVFNNFTVSYALFGGWVFDRYGAGALFATAGVLHREGSGRSTHYVIRQDV